MAVATPWWQAGLIRVILPRLGENRAVFWGADPEHNLPSLYGIATEGLDDLGS